MAALQKGHLIRERATTTTRAFPVAAATVCWEGGMVALSGSGANAVATPGAANNALKIVGMAEGNADNRLGVAGDKKVKTKIGTFLLDNDPSDPIAIGDVGAACYASDDHTVAKTSNSGAKPQAGTIFDVESSGVWVKFA
ncbi:hypothetical protein IY145_10755 [Methylosinus sp. H3A]|uniref:hypothetical protein n=1 Tax=Methylosinus sp. H3A TaxID=2785786 RepID=UPI0018C26FE9|nr:hypothetical protein [Methylosinus sp. H3A]MBG0809858.1 hypothetical protein [Methylosinus sp. H3A]